MKVYTAGKIWHAPKFQYLRDVLGYDVNARWIDLEDSNWIVRKRKDILWQICYEDVRDCKDTIVSFSAETKKMNADLKKFLFKNLYKHEDVMVMTRNADKIISELFAAYKDNISLIPNQFRAYNIQKIQSEKKFRLISDYISGMTDRFAEKEHKKL